MEKKIRKSIAPDEKSGSEKLNAYRILYTRSTKFFDELAKLTAAMFNVQIAVINFVDQDSVWRKEGQPSCCPPGSYRETSICSLAILSECLGTFEGLSAAPKLMTNALIAGELGMNFYAAAPVLTDEGVQVGTVCIVDKAHRNFLPQEQEKLEWVAQMIQKEMNKRTAQRVCA